LKKAFTLIELLVVIAIIAILAAILFPVFAQAKSAAKKAASISNQKQIGLSVIMYMADYDDVYPRNDDCTAGSSLNPANNSRPFNPVGAGCTAPPFHYRMNHYSWQKWVMPYVKNLQLFETPARTKIDALTGSCPLGQWTDCGQIMGGYALNLAITGALNTYGRSPTSAGYARNSWKGGTQSSLPDVSRAMLLMEFSNPDINFSPVIVDPINNPLPNQTVYPMAIREFWAANFKVTDASCNPLPQNNEQRISAGVVVVGHADGSAKAYPVDKFLSLTPTAAEYGVNVDANTKCGVSSGTYRPTSTPNVNINYPMWALGG
jgi:prepilin-type N-terminal cleavage/methylation domain-containing protein